MSELPQPSTENPEARKAFALECLVNGVLPPDQNAAMQAVGMKDYVLGTHQGGVQSDLEAVEYLMENNGIDLAGYPGLGNRVMAYDRMDPDGYNRQYAERAVVDGFYGKGAGFRFVVALPVSLEDREKNGEYMASRIGTAYGSGRHPQDMFRQYGPNAGDKVINARYIAGYLDNDDAYHPNPGFMATSTS